MKKTVLRVTALVLIALTLVSSTVVFAAATPDAGADAGAVSTFDFSDGFLSREDEPVYNGYINWQWANGVRDIRWGLLGVTWKNGCCWVAVYNVLNAFGNMNSAEAIKEMTLFGMPFILGLLGTTPLAMCGYLSSKFSSVFLTLFMSRQWSKIAEGSDCVILLYQHAGLTSAVHCVAGIARSNGKYVFHNERRVSGGVTTQYMDDYLEMLRADGVKLLGMIRLKGKKGDW